MNVKLLVSIFLIAIAAVACTEGVGATNPLQSGASSTRPEPATRQPATATASTTERAAPAATVAPTVQRVATRQPVATVAPRPVASTPSPRATATPRPIATAIKFDRNATPTPLWTPRPKATATSTPAATPVSPTVSAAAQGQFQSQLDYQFSLPKGWSERLTDSSMVVSDPSGKITVTITEQSFERWRFQNIISLGASSFPERPVGWDVWSNTSVGPIKNSTAWEYQFSGQKNGEQYLNFIHWYAWGDLHIQVSTEVPVFDWNFSPTIRAMVNTVTGSFAPHDESNMLSIDEVMAVMYERMDERPSNIYGRDEVLRRRIEFTCRDIYNDLIIEPIYIGGGIWQISARAPESVESWWVFEPSGSIMTLNSNLSRC